MAAAELLELPVLPCSSQDTGSKEVDPVSSWKFEGVKEEKEEFPA